MEQKLERETKTEEEKIGVINLLFLLFLFLASEHCLYIINFNKPPSIVARIYLINLRVLFFFFLGT